MILKSFGLSIKDPSWLEDLIYRLRAHRFRCVFAPDLFTLKKYKTFFRVDIQLYQHEWKLEKREIVWKHDARRAERFHTISSVFTQFHAIDIAI